MKSVKFRTLFLFSAWVIFFASGRNIWSSVLLICAGSYALAELIPKIRKEL